MVPNEEWSRFSPDDLLIVGDIDPPGLISPWLASDVRPKTGDIECDIRNELDGAIAGFGDRLWKHLAGASSALSGLLNDASNPICEVSYSDRYLRNPLAVALLIEAIDGLNKTPAGGVVQLQVAVSTIANSKPPERAPKLVWHDWTTDAARDDLLGRALGACGLSGNVSCSGALPHGRVMTVRFSNGNVAQVRLDQGFSYWRFDRTHTAEYPFQDSYEAQVETLINLQGSVAAPTHSETQIFVQVQ